MTKNEMEFYVNFIGLLLENRHRNLRWTELMNLYNDKYGLVSKAWFSRKVRNLRDRGFVEFERADGRSFYIRLGSVTKRANL